MAQWSHSDMQTSVNQFEFVSYQLCYQDISMPPPQQPLVNYQSNSTPQAQPSTSIAPEMAVNFQNGGRSSQEPPKENPREIRNRAEKMRRDRLNQSIAELASIVPPVIAARRKVDKTTVLRLTAHYLRANQHVFGDSIGRSEKEFRVASMMKTMGLFNGFLITVTYRGVIVVVSQNVQQYLGYTELDLVGQNLLSFTHEADRGILREQLMPKTQRLGANGELLFPNEPGVRYSVEKALAGEKRKFVIRLRKLRQRSEPLQYLICRIEGSMRRSDRATGGSNRGSHVVRRVRARSDNPYSSGNDIVFIAMVRPATETFINESLLEAYRMEYRTRHTIDGVIVHCDSRIALVAGYTPYEVCGLNAMNFMHRDDVRWVIIALREMYDHQRVYGESCYRLMTKNGQFIYMKTQGYLEVDENSRACTSFVCTNTVVDNKEGKYLIKQMREKFTVIARKYTKSKLPGAQEEILDDDYEHRKVGIVHPRHLRPVIFGLVINLTSPAPANTAEENGNTSPETTPFPSQPIAIIPPTKEKIVSGIEKMYDLIKDLDNEADINFEIENSVMDGENLQTSSFNFNNPIASSSQENKVVTSPNTVNNPTYNIFQCGESTSRSGDKICLNGNVQITEMEHESVTTVEAPTDLGFLDDWAAYWTSTAALENENIEYVHEDGQVFDLGYHDSLFLLLIVYLVYSAEEISWNEVTNETMPEPSTNQTSGGIKFDDVDTMIKQKNTEVVSQSAPFTVSCSNVSCNEVSDDEILTHTPMDVTMINSLNTPEPTLLELLATLDDDEFSKYMEQLEKYQDDDA